ncbi:MULTISPECIES: hypothetical protein [Streptomyces]|uniref:hypothetical protein n=1 Tax=Streptomyces TaxID=1883 RepID=UPI0033933556
MEVEFRGAIPALLGHVAPEVKEQAEAAADLNLYDFLKDVFTDGFLVPLLYSAQRDGADDDVLTRCFRFVEILLTSLMRRFGPQPRSR